MPSTKCYFMILKTLARFTPHQTQESNVCPANTHSAYLTPHGRRVSELNIKTKWKRQIAIQQAQSFLPAANTSMAFGNSVTSSRFPAARRLSPARHPVVRAAQL